jgi:hypothetical protein
MDNLIQHSGRQSAKQGQMFTSVSIKKPTEIRRVILVVNRGRFSYSQNLPSKFNQKSFLFMSLGDRTIVPIQLSKSPDHSRVNLTFHRIDFDIFPVFIQTFNPTSRLVFSFSEHSESPISPQSQG